MVGLDLGYCKFTLGMQDFTREVLNQNLNHYSLLVHAFELLCCRLRSMMNWVIDWKLIAPIFNWFYAILYQNRLPCNACKIHGLNWQEKEWFFVDEVICISIKVKVFLKNEQLYMIMKLFIPLNNGQFFFGHIALLLFGLIHRTGSFLPFLDYFCACT